MTKKFLFPVKHRRLPREVGEKARNLYSLHRNGFDIPPTYAVSWDLQKAYEQNGGQFPDSIRNALEEVVDPTKAYSVRSSASVEDSQAQSYAGQFLSLLDVTGVENILNAIQEVWDSAHLEVPTTYQRRQGAPFERVDMGVILQEMIPARYSGVAFSRNPITGLDEVVVEAVEGSGVSLMQDGVTPERWIWKWGKWLQRPDESDLSQDLVREIAVNVREISTLRGHPVDVEWVFDGRRVIWLQVREITALQEIDIYANHIPKEFLPGLIKPLVWSVNVPLVNGAWVLLLTELIGENQLDPLRLARRFYGRAYFNMGLLGSVFRQVGLADNALERLMGFTAESDQGPSFRPSWKALRYLPRLVAFTLGKARFDREIESYLKEARERYDQLEGQLILESTADGIMGKIDQLNQLNQRTAYHNIVSPLLMRFYHQLAKRSLERKGADYARINWLEGWEERVDYDPVPHLRRLGAMYRDLNPIERRALASGRDVSTISLDLFNRQYWAFLDEFGHLSDSGNDFSIRSWEETPEVVLGMIAEFADDPSSGRSKHRFLDDLELPSEGAFVKRAAQASRHREQISFLYTRGVSLFRRAYRRIGEFLHEWGWLDEVDDVFYLEHEELASAIRQHNPTQSFIELVLERKQEYARFEQMTPPPIIYGEELPPIVEDVRSTWRGIPASRGVYRGEVCVVRGSSEFAKVVDGCVLVIPYSDVSWTPLFARAGAVVAEAGGMLSHSSIVAREYGIPAIVSVPHATKLKDGMVATVDGYTGSIILHDAAVGG